MTDTTKVCCEDYSCGWHGLFKEVLVAPHPFEEDGLIHGCPNCRETNVILEACEEPDCWKPSTCGTPTESGYRRTCDEHCPK